MPAEWTELLVAELSEMAYDSFLEEEDGLKAYVVEESFDEEALKGVLARYQDLFSAEYSVQEHEEKNWNEEWEKNFDPVEIDTFCRIRAPFHESVSGYNYELLINPRMSFGTGHHATTALMISAMGKEDFQGKEVMDAGSGTGILAIMAEKLGAKSVFAYDIDDWAFENAPENFKLNDCEKISLQQGIVTSVNHPLEDYDIILANINKNILLDEMEEYAKRLRENGLLFLSGFYEHDLKDIETEANKYGLVLKGHNVRTDWTAAVFSHSQNA